MGILHRLRAERPAGRRVSSALRRLGLSAKRAVRGVFHLAAGDGVGCSGQRCAGRTGRVARRGHYCHAVEARLSDLRVAQGRGARLPDRLQICDANEVLSDSVPNDQVVRGSTALHQPRDVTSMVSVAFEGMCSVSAAQVVDDHSRAALDPGDPAAALELINTHVLGFPPGTEQHQRTGAMLGRFFERLQRRRPCASTDDLCWL